MMMKFTLWLVLVVMKMWRLISKRIILGALILLLGSPEPFFSLGTCSSIGLKVSPKPGWIVGQSFTMMVSGTLKIFIKSSTKPGGKFVSLIGGWLRTFYWKETLKKGPISMIPFIVWIEFWKKLQIEELKFSLSFSVNL